MVRYFGTPNGRWTIGAVLAVAGVLNLVAATASDWVGFGLVGLGAAYALTGLLGRRAGRPGEPVAGPAGGASTGS
jgi:hypothetical protein